MSSLELEFDGIRLVPDVPGGNVIGVSRATLAVLAAAFALAGVGGVTVPLRIQAGVYLVGMVAMNLPHGGYEHFDNLRRRVRSFQLKYVALYLTSIAVFVALFFFAPVVGLVIALGVAMAKGGHGGLTVMDATSGTDHLQTRVQRALAAAVRGGAVMLVPIVFWPNTFHSFSAIMVDIFQPGALAGVTRYFEVTRGVIAAGFGTLLAVHLGLGHRRSTGSGSYLADVFDSLLLVAYFAAVPVVLAVGLYFPFWYSLRQVARTTAVEKTTPKRESPDRDLLSVLDAEDPRLVALGAWGVLIVGALATFGVAATLWVAAPNPLGGASLLPGLVAFWSVFISIIALPHVVIGSWFDRERGIWYVP
jgi:Brp/Blh family beta-carotene 15,15'-monooxygenase